MPKTVEITVRITAAAKERLKALEVRLGEAGYRESESRLIERLLSPPFLQALELHFKEVALWTMGPPPA